MPNPVSWDFKSFDWNFGAAPTDSSSNNFVHNVRHFTAFSEPSTFAASGAGPFKRKAADTSPQPSKQFISERKMIEHLNGLHLSSDFTNHNISASSEACDIDENQPHTVFMSPTDLEQKLKNANKITICEEIRKITDDTILPKSLIERASVPPPYCSALVLWQPPSNVFRVSNDDQAKRDEEDDEQQTVRAVVDSSTMDAELFLDNNNSSNLDFNNLNANVMDLDL